MGDKVIILNKIFQGSWNKQEGNISHEIIDFFKTDKGEHYIYNDPWGHCPPEIYVGEKESNKEIYEAKYMLLTGTGTRDFELLYLIELKEVLHHFSSGKASKNNRDIIVSKYIKPREIKYGGVSLDQIYGKDDDSLLVTFQASAIYKPKKRITSGLPQQYKKGEGYVFQRNKGYINNKEYKNDYDNIISLIEDNEGNVDSNTWTKLELPTINPSDLITQRQNKQSQKTFLDMIYKTDSEECFTNMLYSILSQKDLFYQFCNEFKADTQDISNIPFKVEREKVVSNGRMDISGEAKSEDTVYQRVIIENKIWSGLNGVNERKKITQLSTYYDLWGKEDNTRPILEPLCFVIAPNYRIRHVEEEINDLDPAMKDVYGIIPYSKIADFIEKHMNQIEQYSEYVKDCLLAFKKHAYENEQELFTQLFKDAIANVE